MSGLTGARIVALGVCAAIGITACAADREAELVEDEVGEAMSPIINGMQDSTHTAVVAWLHGSKCSATIVAKNGSTGYALTAAHCLGGPNGTLRQGNNHNNPDRTYNVVEQEVHPRYGEANAFDFAMLKFTGADAATPVTDVLSPAMDDMGPGSPATLVGYGQNPGNNSVRRSADVVVGSFLTNDIYLSWNQSGGNGGVCSGDSGGPALYDVAGTEYVAAVHSFVSPDCFGNGVSSRASAVRDSFILPYINGQPYGRESCEACADAHQRVGTVSGCGDDIIQCLNNQSCADYVSCLQGCSTLACQNQCGQDNVFGKQLYDGINDCVCTEACAVECTGADRCDEPPACWIDLEDDTCEACMEGACCAEATACSTDNVCLTCALGSSNPNCGFNENLNALETCIQNSCASQCPDFGPTGQGGDPGTGGAAGVGGAGVGPAGVGGGSIDNGSDDDDDGQVVSSGCSVSPDQAGRDAPLIAFLLGLAAIGLRRRR